MKINNKQELDKAKERGIQSLFPNKPKLSLSFSSCALASGAESVWQNLLEGKNKQEVDCIISKTSCLGSCNQQPMLTYWEPGKGILFFHHITPEKTADLFSAIKKGGIVKDYAFCQLPGKNLKVKGSLKGFEGIPQLQELSFFASQKRIMMKNFGLIDPGNIDEYIAMGGYYSLYKALTQMTPEEVIGDVTKSGLRGRGGAGFSTGMKWNFTRKAEGKEKFVICNADEGDPGAFMDRALMESDPHRIIEGLLIAGYAIGAHEGYFYIREEYPRAFESLQTAVEQAQDYGFIGRDIFNTGFNFIVKLVKGARSYICGEETALMDSVEGTIGEARQKPPFPAQSGLWGKPTNVNNVETLSNVPFIIEQGAETYAEIGTEKSKGTKLFSLVGRVKNSGLIEVPMGIRLKELIYDIGGGMVNNKDFKAVQTGSPFGSCLPKSHIDVQVDFEHLAEAGSMLGSGALIVLDESSCMVDWTRYLLEFLREESCGKCVPCREGIDRMYQILDGICRGRGSEEDLNLLRELGDVVKNFSLCALGGVAPEPVLNSLRFFKDEYQAHIKDKKCPAGVCSI
jgi:NADH:ubiquinone oxidoreductase subunit F (NADH-binding)/(2Fe-2S) ferredoxin